MPTTAISRSVRAEPTSLHDSDATGSCVGEHGADGSEAAAGPFRGPREGRGDRRLGPADDDAAAGSRCPLRRCRPLSGIAHERFTADEVGRLLDELATLEAELDYDSDDAS